MTRFVPLSVKNLFSVQAPPLQHSAFSVQHFGCGQRPRCVVRRWAGCEHDPSIDIPARHPRRRKGRHHQNRTTCCAVEAAPPLCGCLRELLPISEPNHVSPGTGILPQPVEPLKRAHFPHVVLPSGLQHSSEPLISPHFGHKTMSTAKNSTGAGRSALRDSLKGTHQIPYSA